MKLIFTVLILFFFLDTSYAQQASDYFPTQTGFEWEFKEIPLDSANNPIVLLALFRIDSFATVTSYQGKMANIVATKNGELNTISFQPYLDSLFYNTDGSDGYEYFSIRNIEQFLISLDSLGITGSFSFLDFFTSLQSWYANYRFASPVNSEYTLLTVDTTITISTQNVLLTFKYSGTRLQDEMIQTVRGNFDCKKFLLKWNVKAFNILDLLTLSDTIWIAPDNWIVQDIIPGQYVDNLTFLGVDPFSIIGLETKLTDEIVSVVTDKQIPSQFVLKQNFPNPFNPSTTIQYQIPQQEFISLKVYDVLGNEVATLVNEEKPAGTYKVEFSTLGLSSGLYFYTLSADSFRETKKMILMK